MMSKFQSFWNLASDASRPGVLNMYVYGRITSSSHWLFGSETDVVTSQFVKDLRKYPEAKRINVYINSPGGDVFAAAAINNQLKAHAAEVHSYIDGLGASAAVGLAMGADVVHMSRSALIMIHNPATRVEGEVKDLEKGVEVLQKVKTTIINIYQEKTGLPEDRLAALMDEESWLTADEALSLGFIDKIAEDEGLTVENIDDGVVVNGVTFNFTNEAAMKVGAFTFCNNLSGDKLKEKLSTIQNKQGGNQAMSFEEILNAMQPEQKTLFDNHIQNMIANAVAAKQTEWDTEKSVLNARITTLEAAQAALPAEDPEEAILNSLTPEARAIVDKAREQAKTAEAELAAAKATEAYNAFKGKMGVYDALPIQDDQMQALHQLSVTDEKSFAQIENLLKISNEAMKAGFVPAGSDQGTPAAQNALDEINAKVSALRAENKDMDYNTALRQVANEHPELYQRYREEA
ncbi:MAG: head maturation protease, ClpP-related [Saccharofermentanales bacterium]